jgi:hypothetical protein
VAVHTLSTLNLMGGIHDVHLLSTPVNKLHPVAMSGFYLLSWVESVVVACSVAGLVAKNSCARDARPRACVRLRE